MPTRNMDYGFSNLQLLASSNPDCLYSHSHSHINLTYPPKKHILPLNCTPDIVSIYEHHALPNIVRLVEDVVTNANANANVNSTHHEAQIHLLRMGRDAQNHHRNPVVILVLLTHGAASPSTAERIVSHISAAFTTHNKDFNIDVCQFRQDHRCDEQDKTQVGIDLHRMYADVYHDYPPLPGASIGPTEHKKCIGTICGYVTHKGVAYAVTNCHVANGSAAQVLGSYEPYRHAHGQKKHLMMLPSDADHEATLEALHGNRTRMNNLQLILEKQGEQLKDLQQYDDSQDLQNKIESNERRLTEIRSVISTLQTTIARAESYDRCLGYVVAASGSIPPRDPSTQCRQDWALICVGDSFLFRNQHRRFPPLTRSNSLSNLITDLSRLGEHQVNYPIDRKWLEMTGMALLQSPAIICAANSSFSSALESGAPVIKPPSARSDFEIGVFNDVRATLIGGHYGRTREWTFIHSMSDAQLSKPGDSGSSLLNRDYETMAMLWGGSILASVGDGHDLTFATPITDVIRDIEKTMEWEHGSCAWL